jgi:hypothetical protein
MCSPCPTTHLHITCLCSSASLHTTHSPLPHHCHTTPTPLPHHSHTTVTPLPHHYHTTATSLQLFCIQPPNLRAAWHTRPCTCRFQPAGLHPPSTMADIVVQMQDALEKHVSSQGAAGLAVHDYAEIALKPTRAVQATPILLMQTLLTVVLGVVPSGRINQRQLCQAISHTIEKCRVQTKVDSATDAATKSGAIRCALAHLRRIKLQKSKFKQCIKNLPQPQIVDLVSIMELLADCDSIGLVRKRMRTQSAPRVVGELAIPHKELCH